MTPNKIVGMKLRGIGRAPIHKHLKKQDKSFFISLVRFRKHQREIKQYEKANRAYSY